MAQIRYGGYTVYADKNAVIAIDDIAIPAKANQNTRDISDIIYFASAWDGK